MGLKSLSTEIIFKYLNAILILLLITILSACTIIDTGVSINPLTFPVVKVLDFNSDLSCDNQHIPCLQQDYFPQPKK